MVHAEQEKTGEAPRSSPSSFGMEVYFDDPRLRMTTAGRILVRIISYAGYLILAATAFVFTFLSDLAWLRALGVLLNLFLLDRAAHMGEADLPISELPKKGRVNLARVLRPRAFAALEKAHERAGITGSVFVLELARALLGVEEVEEGLLRLDVKPGEFRTKLEGFLETQKGEDGEARRTEAEALTLRAFASACAARHRFVEPGDLFAAVAQDTHPLLTRLLTLFAIDAADVEKALLFGAVKREFSRLRGLPLSLGGFFFAADRRIRHRVMNRAWTARPTPALDRVATDLTDLAREESIGFLIGHEEEYQKLVDTLSRSTNPNALLVGEAGAGKETLVSHLAFRLVKDEVPPPLFDKRLVSLELGSLVGSAPAEELQARLKTIAEEIVVAGNIILYIPEIHNLVKTSGTAYLSAADALLPIIKNSAFPVIGTTYPREFKGTLEPRSDFVGLFETILVNEVSEEEAERLLAYESVVLEAKAKVFITFGAVKKAVAVAHRYLRPRLLPGSGEELLKAALDEAVREGEKVVGPEFVTKVAEAKVHVPLGEARGKEAEKLLNLEAIIHERLIDQEEAVKAVADALREYRSGLLAEKSPIANFLFVGPTGVGKTELAKTLAKVQFGSEAEMIRFDMSEYQDKKSFYRLIGSPEGDLRGTLTDAIREKPYALILLDEFEKAFPDILDLFLQVFDDGRLTDNLGRTVDFRNTIIIATSNAHSDIINEALAKGEAMAEIAEYLKKKLTDVFKPELLNRFSRVVIFRDLSPENLEKIVALNLKDLAAAAEAQGITITFDPAAVKEIVRLGYDPSFGARPLRRVIDEKLRAPLAEEILRQKLGRGSEVRLALKDGAFVFLPEPSPP